MTTASCVDTQSERAETNFQQIEKYKEVILACICYGANTYGTVTKTKLAKLIYLADFSWYYQHLTPMTDLRYRRIQQWPVPDEYFRIIDELLDEGVINIEIKWTAFMIGKNEDIPCTILSLSEIELIRTICEKWKNQKTQNIIDFTHDQLPWKICRMGEIIPYELIIQEEPDHVY